MSNGTNINDCWNKIGVRGDHSCPLLQQHVHCRNCPVYASAAAVLLDRPLPGDYQAEWTRHVAEPKQQEEQGAQSLLIFRLGQEWLALPGAVFVEVAEPGPVHSLPHRPRGVVRGLTNVRGQLLVCMSLGETLALDTHALPVRGAYPRLLVIQFEGNRLAFSVDEVAGLQRYHPRQLQAVPATVAKTTAAYSKAVLPWQGKAVAFLDEQLLFYTLNRSLA